MMYYILQKIVTVNTPIQWTLHNRLLTIPETLTSKKMLTHSPMENGIVWYYMILSCTVCKLFIEIIIYL